ncbi:GM17874 [Drosophila sechellia]|uniref:GM17874 n=1 Tax=Drosophila sechellia TaxID=7238 RepID=B4I277_DROSE|nr:GM17874 [Drosophila sechellia]
MPKDKYCMMCNRSHCKICTTIYHRGHCVRKLSEINQRYASEIPTTLNSLNLTRIHVLNGKQVSAMIFFTY